MRAQERAEEIAQLKKRATVPATLGLIGFDIERDGIYFLQLVFDPKGTPLPAFEQELRNNLGGEIEIVVNGDPFKTIRYEDFVGFAPAPVGEGYGPVYAFQVDFPGQPFARAVKDILGEHVSVQIDRRSELHAFKVVPKRWIVEQGFAWLEKNRSVCGRTASGFQYQLAVRSSRISCSIAEKIVNRLQALPR